VYATTSATYEDVPLLDAISVDTDMPAAVLVTLSVPALGFLRSEAIVPSGMGRLGLDVDGTIVEETLHRPLSEGQASPGALVAVVPVEPGHHVLRIRRRVDDLTTASRFLDGDVIEGVGMEKIFHATVLESLETFVDLSMSNIGPQGESPPEGPMKSLEATLRTEGAVMAGLHAPLLSAMDDAGETNGRLELLAGVDRIDAALHGDERLERSASLLWMAPAAPGGSFTASAGRGADGPLLLPRGARLFAASFRASDVAPPPAPVVVSGSRRAAHGTITDVATLRWNPTVATKLLISANAARLSSMKDGGSGFLTLRRDDQIVARTFFQSQSKGEGQGVSIFALTDVPPGPSVITLQLESRLGDAILGDEHSQSALTALPLR
jgi:hypothetical protein